MEELLVYAILLYEELVTENDDLLCLEWETDIKKAIIYVRTHIDFKSLNYEQFGRILKDKLRVVYENCSV